MSELVMVVLATVAGLVLLAVLFRKIYVRSRARAYERWKREVIKAFEYHLTCCELDVFPQLDRVLYGPICMVVRPYDSEAGRGTCIGIVTTEEVVFGKHTAQVTLLSGAVIRNLPFNGRFVRVPNLKPREIASIRFDVREGVKPT